MLNLRIAPNKECLGSANRDDENNQCFPVCLRERSQICELLSLWMTHVNVARIVTMLYSKIRNIIFVGHCSNYDIGHCTIELIFTTNDRLFVSWQEFSYLKFIEIKKSYSMIFIYSE